jgi:hypothetical protein
LRNRADPGLSNPDRIEHKPATAAAGPRQVAATRWSGARAREAKGGMSERNTYSGAAELEDDADALEAEPEDADGPAPALPGRLPGGLRRKAAMRLCRLPGMRGVVRQLLPVPTDPGVPTPPQDLSNRLIAGLSRHSRRRALARLTQLPCFRDDEYLAMHPDVARSRRQPGDHGLFYGAFEERRLFRPAVLATCLGAPPAPPASLPLAAASLPRIALYVSSHGNIFMREIADDLAASLRAAGATVDVCDETAPIERRSPVSVFVAPHEFFLLGRGIEWVRDDIVAGSVMLNTEQPQTRWFGRALVFLLASGGVIDICAQSAALFAAAMPSLHLTLAPPSPPTGLAEDDRQHPLFRVLPAAAKTPPSPHTPFAARPIDIAFFGTESRHRDQWLARHASMLAAFENVIHYRREKRGPIRQNSPDHALTRLATHVAGHAKIALNLHRDAYTYLEWHRMVRQGMATGAVVVSEPCLPHPLLTPGVHYLEESGRQLPDLIAWLLRSEDGRRAAAEVQANARALLADRVTPQLTAAQMLGFLHTLAPAGVR